MKKHLILFLLLLFSTSTWAATSAPIVMYHRFGDERYPTTNTPMDQFTQHLNLIMEQGSSSNPIVWHLPQIIDTLNRREELPEGIMAITIDDAFASFYQNAYPLLKERGIPFTLFVSAGEIDKNLPDYMTWDQLREVAKDKLATIGHHGYSHESFLQLDENQLRHEIITANKRFETELGMIPALISYPYGEYDDATLAVIKDFGFVAGFSQTSGVADRALPQLDLPRFALNENYGEPERFKLIIGAKPLFMDFFEPQNPHLSTPMPEIRFKLGKPYAINHLQCYAAGSVQPLRLIKDPDNEQTFITRPWVPFTTERPRINCTLVDQGKWHWFGKMYYLKDSATE